MTPDYLVYNKRLYRAADTASTSIIQALSKLRQSKVEATKLRDCTESLYSIDKQDDAAKHVWALTKNLVSDLSELETLVRKLGPYSKS